MNDRTVAMGQIIAFQPRETRAKRAATPEAEGAQILFFLGVRYLRLDENAPASGGQAPECDSSAGGARKRRRRARG